MIALRAHHYTWSVLEWAAVVCCRSILHIMVLLSSSYHIGLTITPWYWNLLLYSLIYYIKNPTYVQHLMQITFQPFSSALPGTQYRWVNIGIKAWEVSLNFYTWSAVEFEPRTLGIFVHCPKHLAMSPNTIVCLQLRTSWYDHMVLNVS